MNIEEYNYDLPQELIAQTPLKNRSDSKLLIMDKNNGERKEDIFKNVIDYITPNDILVLNDTKVIPARLIGEKEDTKAVIELLLLKNIENNNWECLSRPQKRLHIGTIITFGNGLLKAKVIKKMERTFSSHKFIKEYAFQNQKEYLFSKRQCITGSRCF